MKKFILEDIRACMNELKEAGRGVIQIVKGLMTIIWRILIFWCAFWVIIGDVVAYGGEKLIEKINKVLDGNKKKEVEG